jgi:hypothetical protein
MQLKGANEGKFNPADGRFRVVDRERLRPHGRLADLLERVEKDRAGKAIARRVEVARKIVVDVFESRDEADMFRASNGDVRTGFEPFDPDKMPKGLEAAARRRHRE